MGGSFGLTTDRYPVASLGCGTRASIGASDRLLRRGQLSLQGLQFGTQCRWAFAGDFDQIVLLMLSGDERDRTANLLVANQAVETIANHSEAILYLRLQGCERFPGFIRISQEFAWFITVCLPWQSFMRRCDQSNRFPSRRSLFVHSRSGAEPLSRPRSQPTGRARLKLSCRGGPAYNQRIAANSSEGSQTMGMLDKESDADTDQVPGVQNLPHASSPRPVPCNDARGRVLPITPEEQARNAKAIAELVERMLAMPDEDPPGAWEEAMRDLDAHRPHRKLFEDLY